MKTLVESINDSISINESSKKYAVVFLTFDKASYCSDPDSGLSSYLYENEKVKNCKFTASNDKAAINKAQKMIDKLDIDDDDVIGGTLYNMGNQSYDTEDGEVVETLYHSKFDEWFKEFCKSNDVDCNY